MDDPGDIEVPDPPEPETADDDHNEPVPAETVTVLNEPSVTLEEKP